MNHPRPLHHVLARRILAWAALAVALLAISTPAMAHHLPPGFEDVDDFEQSRMVSGFLHPFTGLDHLLLALAVGWMAFAGGARRGGAILASFLASLAVGMVAGRLGAGLPMLEQGLALSVVLGGLALGHALRRVPSSALLLSAAAGLWHGNAHGAEMPASASAWAYGAALMLGTAAIAGAGTGLAALCSCRDEPIGRWVGAGVTVAGVWLWLA